MSSVFLTLLNMSITASWLILAVIVIRLLLKKAPKWISCALWALVAIRLICPLSFESKLSLIPASQTIPQNIAMQANPGLPYFSILMSMTSKMFFAVCISPRCWMRIHLRTIYNEWHADK